MVAAENTGLAPFWTLVSGYNFKQSSRKLEGLVGLLAAFIYAIRQNTQYDLVHSSG